MGSMIVRYGTAEGARWGILTSGAPTRADDEIEVAEIAAKAKTTEQLIGELEAGLQLRHDGERRKLRAAALLSPVTTDATLICQGLNYRTHVEETGVGERQKNLFFSKASSSLSGPYEDIVRPDGVELLDYEVEVGIVLRRELKAGDIVTEENLGDYVAGVVLCNDISARDAMFGAVLIQWYEGKSFRTFCPAGPVLYWLPSADVRATLSHIGFTLGYKGILRQKATMSEMIYKPAETLTQFARIGDLKAGDMVLTGTPGGVLLGQGSAARMAQVLKDKLFDDGRRVEEFREELKSNVSFLQPGDTLELTMRDERAKLDLGGQNYRIVQG